MNKKQAHVQKKETRKKEAHARKERNLYLRKMKKYEPAQISGLIPISAWDAEGNFGIMSDGSLIDFLQIRCKNLYNASEDEIHYDNTKWDKLFLTYPDDLKFIVMNFPPDISKQLSYVKKVAQRTENPVLFSMLENEYERILDIAERTTDRDYYLVFFAQDYTQYLDRKSKIKGVLNQGKALVFEMTQEKKELILYKLNNLNANIIFRGRGDGLVLEEP